MRDLHADLLTAQTSGAADPYIRITIGGTNYTSRLIALEHIEEPYRDRAVIILTNSDRHFNDAANDLRGKSLLIGYGYTCAGSTDRYLGDGDNVAMPTLWVKSQSLVSMEGELVCILECEGGWMKLREFIFTVLSTPAYFNQKFTSTDSIYELIEKALAVAGFTLSSESVDDIIQSFYPIFIANPLTYENLANIVYALIRMTKCYLRQIESLGFETVYPQSSDAVKETYYSRKAPYFREYVEKTNLLVPNHIVVFCNRDPDGTWSSNMITGHARDPDQFTDETYTGNYTEIQEFHIAPFISTQADADNRAAAIITRYMSETLSGRLVLPFHDCRVELYDKVEVEETRGK